MKPGGNAWRAPAPGGADPCARFLARHSAYLDDDLTPELRVLHEAHEASCEACAHYAGVLRQGTSILRELPDIAPATDFEERLQHRIFHLQDESALGGGRRLGSGWLLAAAALAAIAVAPQALERLRAGATDSELQTAAGSASGDLESGLAAGAWQPPPVPMVVAPAPLPPALAGYSPVVVRTPQYQPVSFQLVSGE